MLALRLQKSISIEIYFLSTLWTRIDAAVSLVYDHLSEYTCRDCHQLTDVE